MISVVMPVYDAEKYLDEAIQSILNQTYKDFEFIIINDGSTDKSLEIIEKYKEQDERITLISRENKGLISSLNEGITRSKGEYIARMDADDISAPTRFQKQIEQIEIEGADICGSHYHVINDNGKLIDHILTPLNNNSLILYLIFSVPFAHGATLIRRQFLLDNKLEYGQGYIYAEDKYLWIQIYNLNGKFTNVNDSLFYYREISESKSRVQAKELYQDVKNMKIDFIKDNYNSVNTSFEIMSKGFRGLSGLEQEHLLDLAFILGIKKISILKKASIRQVVISILKFIQKIFK